MYVSGIVFGFIEVGSEPSGVILFGTILYLVCRIVVLRCVCYPKARSSQERVPNARRGGAGGSGLEWVWLAALRVYTSFF